MALAQAMALLRKAAPLAAKQLPKLWPLLLESKNRQWVMETVADLASQSPKRRLRARIELTAALADEVGAQATSDGARARAEDWARRARNLLHRLDMPVAGRQARVAHRRSIRSRLEVLQAEMNDYLGG